MYKIDCYTQVQQWYDTVFTAELRSGSVFQELIPTDAALGKERTTIRRTRMKWGDVVEI